MAESSNFFIGITIPYYASLLNNCYHYIIITLSLFYIASNKSQETLHLSFYQSIFTKPLPLFPAPSAGPPPKASSTSSNTSPTTTVSASWSPTPSPPSETSGPTATRARSSPRRKTKWGCEKDDEKKGEI